MSGRIIHGDDEEPESILGTAERIINGNRQSDNGHPTDNHSRTATLWVTYLEGKYGITVPIDPEDVCFMNILQKIGREMHRKTRDGIVDIAGYAGNIEMIRERESDSAWAGRNGAHGERV